MLRSSPNDGTPRLPNDDSSLGSRCVPSLGEDLSIDDNDEFKLFWELTQVEQIVHIRPNSPESVVWCRGLMVSAIRSLLGGREVNALTLVFFQVN